MSERLTWEEIKKLYPNQWVGLREVKVVEGTMKPESGVVVRTNLTFDECNELALEDSSIWTYLTGADKALVNGKLEHLSWDEICKKYPNQWLGISDIVEGGNNMYKIKSATVKYVGLNHATILHLQCFMRECKLVATSKEIIEPIRGY